MPLHASKESNQTLVQILETPPQSLAALNCPESWLEVEVKIRGEIFDLRERWRKLPPFPQPRPLERSRGTGTFPLQMLLSGSLNYFIAKEILMMTILTFCTFSQPEKVDIRLYVRAYVILALVLVNYPWLKRGGLLARLKSLYEYENLHKELR